MSTKVFQLDFLKLENELEKKYEQNNKNEILQYLVCNEEFKSKTGSSIRGLFARQAELKEALKEIEDGLCNINKKMYMLTEAVLKNA